LLAPPFRRFLVHKRFVGQFCVYPCDDPSAQAIANGFPPNRTSSVPNPDAQIFSDANAKLTKRDAPSHKGEDLLDPPYAIDNAQGVLSDRTAYVGLACDVRLINEC
jgi:alpha-glucosidase